MWSKPNKVEMQSSKRKAFAKAKASSKRISMNRQRNKTKPMKLGWSHWVRRHKNEIRSTRLPKQVLKCSNNENQVTNQVKRAGKSQINRLRRQNWKKFNSTGSAQILHWEPELITMSAQILHRQPEMSAQILHRQPALITHISATVLI